MAPGSADARGLACHAAATPDAVLLRVEGPAGPGAGARPEGEVDQVLVPLEISADAPLVAFLGDSISAGLHLPADQAFPAVLQRTLVERGLPFRMINAGISGDTTTAAD